MHNISVTLNDSVEPAPARLDGLLFGSQSTEIALTKFDSRTTAGRYGSAYASAVAVASSAMSPKVSLGSYQIRAVQGTSIAESTTTLLAGNSSNPWVLRDPDGSSVVSVSGTPNEVIHSGIYRIRNPTGGTVDAELVAALPRIALNGLGVGSYRIPAGSMQASDALLVVLTSTTEACHGHNVFLP